MKVAYFIAFILGIHVAAGIEIQINIPHSEGEDFIQDFNKFETLNSIKGWVKSNTIGGLGLKDNFLFVIASSPQKYHIYSETESKLSLQRLETKGLMYPNIKLTVVNLVPTKYSPFILKKFKSLTF